MILYLSEGRNTSLASQGTEEIKLCLLRGSLKDKEPSKIKLKLNSRKLGILVQSIFSIGGGKDKFSD
jgi:hypothetical protein